MRMATGLVLGSLLALVLAGNTVYGEINSIPLTGEKSRMTLVGQERDALQFRIEIGEFTTMDVETAIEQEIEPVLARDFGLSFSKCRLTMGTLAYVTSKGGETQRYRALVDSICSGERVLHEWGAERAARQAEEWKDLVPLEPEPVIVLTSAPT